MNFNDIELPSNRKFGFFFTTIFFLATCYTYIYDFFYSSYVLFFITLSFLIISIVKPNSLIFLNRLWMRLGFFLGMIINPIVLGLIFFGLFAPVSILTRIFGRDQLRIKIISRDTYWKNKSSEITSTHSFKNQF